MSLDSYPTRRENKFSITFLDTGANREDVLVKFFFFFFWSLFYKELRTPRRSEIKALLKDKALPFIHYYSATLSES